MTFDEAREFRDLEEELDAWGAAERRDLEEALALEAAPGEESVAETVRTLAEGSQATEVATWPKWAALAAAGILAALGAWAFFPVGDGQDGPPVILGDGFEGLNPQGTLSGSPEGFRWTYDLAPGGWFLVEVFDSSDAPVLRSPELETPLWELTGSQRQALPPEFRWEVRAFGPTGLEDSAEARCRRGP